MGFDFANFDLERSLIVLLCVVISITIHEFAHAFAADRIGDDLPRRQGRLTLLPTEHFDPLGFIMIVWMSFGGIGLGWGKPVQVNPGAFKHPRRDMILIAAAGPFSNLIQAAIAGLIIRLGGLELLVGADGMTLIGHFLIVFLSVNLGLMLFNLIPIPPLDGSKILSNLLPFEQSVRYDRFMGQYGFMLLIGLVFLAPRVLGMIIGPAQAELAALLTGLRLFG
jgi:Zn-dependent protease